MIKTETLDNLLENFIENIPELTAALIVDVDGLIIAQKSIKGFDEEIIGAIMAILDQTMNKVKRFAETSFGSGTLDTNEFRLFYLELGGDVPALFVLVADPYSDIDKYIPYSYLVAERVSLALHDREIETRLPKLLEDGTLRFNSHNSDSGSVKNILVIGSSQVGKTTLTQLYANQEFIEAYKPTIGISVAEKELQITQQIKSTLYLFDMGGLKTFAKIRKYFYQKLDAKTIMIVFDYTREETLNDVSDWFDEANLFNKESEVNYILVGNKVDLIDDTGHLRIRAEEIAMKHNCQFFETSAQTGQGIDELFMNIAF
ncbi:MAG: GTP-binding protein [Candidatus Lokiarchaeota archaeon]|nr:GTP-binding protein [Candidatus Lokiarchaeota archaeon]